MPILRRLMLSGLVVAFLPIGLVAQSDPGRLYGRIVMMDGNVFEGFMRWDKNEGHWADILEGSKVVRARANQQDGRTFMGVRFADLGLVNRQTAQSAIRVGHVAKIVAYDDHTALLTLRNGDEWEFRPGTTDLGPANRGIFVRDASGEERSVRWRNIDFLEFLPAPNVASPFGERLYGVVETEAGVTFTGWVTWDRDEVFGRDVLDGDAGRESHKIPFADIAQLRRVSDSRTTVTFKNGRELVLSGSNDVNRSNNGILVGDPGLGQVSLTWSQFVGVTFSDPPTRQLEFDGGHRLEGTVYTISGGSHAGIIRWDNDEEWSWEMLDGEFRGMEIDVELGQVRSIRKVDSGSEVILWDGRSLLMNGSNDVNSENRGIFIRGRGDDETRVRWAEFERVEFRRR